MGWCSVYVLVKKLPQKRHSNSSSSNINDCLCCASLNRISGSVFSHKFYSSVHFWTSLVFRPPALGHSPSTPTPAVATPSSTPTPSSSPPTSAPSTTLGFLYIFSKLIKFIKIYVTYIYVEKNSFSNLLRIAKVANIVLFLLGIAVCITLFKILL